MPAKNPVNSNPEHPSWFLLMVHELGLLWFDSCNSTFLKAAQRSRFAVSERHQVQQLRHHHAPPHEGRLAQWRFNLVCSLFLHFPRSNWIHSISLCCPAYLHLYRPFVLFFFPFKLFSEIRLSLLYYASWLSIYTNIYYSREIQSAHDTLKFLVRT